MGCKLSASTASAAVSPQKVTKEAWGSSSTSACTSLSLFESAAVSSSAVGKQARRENKKSSSTSAYLKYEIGEKIGKGSYAQVHFAIIKQTRIAVAVKIHNLHPKATKTSQQQKHKVLKSSANEVTLWNAVGTHVNCVQLLDSFFDDFLVYMVMEKCDCSLYKYFQRCEVVYETCLGKKFEQILIGISHMHSVSVIHRDLKPDNFLVRGNIVKICDFGLSSMMPNCGHLETICGTPPYLPPEMLAKQTYDQKADVWSFGVVAYLFLCGEFPYETSDGSARMMKKSILNGAPADCRKEWLTNNAVSFLQQVLQRNPFERPTAILALQLAFITNPHTECLSSLHGVLNNASNTGAFDSNDLLSVTYTDQILDELEVVKLDRNSTKSFASVDVNASSTPRLKDTKATIVTQVDEVLPGTPCPESESTSCGSSAYSSSASEK